MPGKPKPHFVYIDYAEVVNAPIADAFSLIERVQDWPSWVRRIKRAEVRSPGPLAPGSKIAFEADFAPGLIPLTIFHLERNRRIGWGLGNPAGPFGYVEHWFGFEEAGPGRTRVRHVEEAFGLVALLTRIGKRTAYRFNYDWAQDLRRYFDRKGA